MSEVNNQVMVWGGIELKGSLRKDSYLRVPMAPIVKHQDGTCSITVAMDTNNETTNETVTLSFKSDSDEARLFKGILAKGWHMEAKLTTKEGKDELEICPIDYSQEVDIE